MFESEAIEAIQIPFPIRLRCKKDQKSNGTWLPLEQDWSNRWCTLPKEFLAYAERISGFETRESDVFVVTFTKAGTTWMQELAWLLLNQLNFERAKKSYTAERSLYIEHSGVNNVLEMDSVIACDEMISPRLIKSHLPAQLLPRSIWQQGRIIYVARNPKDVVVSCFHFWTGIKYFDGSLDKFVDEFINDKVVYASFWSHVVDVWRMRNQPNIFFVTYEEMKRDLKGVIERLVKFLGLQDLNEKHMEQLLEHLSFESMKGNKYSNPTEHIKGHERSTEDFEFMRRGIIGAYKDELSQAQREKLDKWTRDTLKEYGICESDIFGEI